jgi:purine-nucleoside phosphorylase
MRTSLLRLAGNVPVFLVKDRYGENAMLYEEIMEATAAIRLRDARKPSLAVILGSGLGDLADAVENAVSISYADIPHFVTSTVKGHAGRLLIGELQGVPLVVMQGRLHMYEGYHAHNVTFPVRVMHMLGAQTLIVSNAAGGINPTYRPGDFMLIKDHINLPGIAGANPLIGPNDERLGERFIPGAGCYDTELRVLTRRIAATLPDVTLHEGIYTMVTGPHFETPAELRFLRTIGSDAVGMSTVPEVLVARHMGMRVLGISLITNSATGEEGLEVNHNEVLATADAARFSFASLVREIVSALNIDGSY